MRSRCIDCNHRYQVGRSKRCNICKKKRTRDQTHGTHLKKRYNITIQDYYKMFDAQGGKCWICRGGTSKNYLATDHDHKTGEVRGLLCANCNKVLGRFRDDPKRFRKAATYLVTPPARKVLGKRKWRVLENDSTRTSSRAYRRRSH